MKELMVAVFSGRRQVVVFSNDTDWERTAPLCGDQGETGVGERGGLGGEEGRKR